MRSSGGGRELGAIAATLLALCAFVSLLLAAGFLELRRSSQAARAEMNALGARAALDRAVCRAIEEIAADPTPESDGPTDPIWGWVGSTAASELLIELSDVSSRINPNWVRRGLFEKSSLSTLFSPDATVSGPPLAELLERRAHAGFFADLERGYGALFSKEAIDRYLTAWSYANINTTDELALTLLYELRTGDSAAAEVFRTRLRGLLAERRLVREEELRSFLDADYEKLFPVVNALPSWNVHYLPPLLLEQLLAYPDYGVAQPAARVAHLLALRRTREITPQELVRIVGLPADHPIYQYLGTRTWFWRIAVTSGEGRLAAVVCRLPPEYGEEGLPAARAPGSPAARFRVVFRE